MSSIIDDKTTIHRIFDKLDRIDEKFERKFEKIERAVDINGKELAIYNEQLKLHIEGVRQAREENKMLRKYIDNETEKIISEVKPVVKHVSAVRTIGMFVIKFSGFVSVCSGTIYGLGKALGWF